MNINSKNDGAAAVLAEAARPSCQSRQNAMGERTPPTVNDGKNNGAAVTRSRKAKRLAIAPPLHHQPHDDLRAVSAPGRRRNRAHDFDAGQAHRRYCRAHFRRRRQAFASGPDGSERANLRRRRDHPHPHAVKSAGAVELIHTTTLLHDDVVDDALVRRGKPAANLVWGNETSVLVGDFLFAQVFVNAAEGFGRPMLLPWRLRLRKCAPAN